MNIYPGLNVTEYLNDLKNADFTTEQAESIVRTSTGLSFNVVDAKHLANKNDLLMGLKDIRIELKDMENRLLLKIAGMIGLGIAIVSFIRGIH